MSYHFNLQRRSDYAKANLAQNQELQIQILNDRNISNARQAVALGIPETIPEVSLQTADQIQENQSVQESMTINNLLSLGFKYQDVQFMLPRLTPDQRFKFNMTFTAIQSNFKSKFKVELVTSTFFLEYLAAYISELDASKGLNSVSSTFISDNANRMIESVADLKAILPNRNQFRNVINAVHRMEKGLTSDGFHVATYLVPVIERLELLANNLPDEDYFDRVEFMTEENDVRAFESIQNIQTLLADIPTKAEMETLLQQLESGQISHEDALAHVEMIVGSMDQKMMKQLADYGTASDAGSSPRDQQHGPAEMNSPFGLLSVISGSINKIYYVPAESTDGKAIMLTLPKLRTFYADKSMANSEFFGRVRSAGCPSLKVMNAFIRTNSQGIKQGGISFQIDEPVKKEGSGLRGEALRTKIGKGIAITPKPKYVEFGKYIMDLDKLSQADILHIKYPSMHRVPQLKPTMVGEGLKNLFLNFVNTGNVNRRLYDSLSASDKELFEHTTTASGIFSQLDLPKVDNASAADDLKRFDILRGEILAGNSSHLVLEEIRKLVMKFIAQHRITKSEGHTILIELGSK